MRIAITGVTGFIGKALAAALLERGDTVYGFSRRAVSLQSLLPDVQALSWPVERFPNVDAVVNLAGESVAGRWTPEKKRAIRESRVSGTCALVDAIKTAEERPRVLVSASAVGFYGNRGEETLTETSAPGTGFLPDVSREWEGEALRAGEAGLRVALLRTGIVLGAEGGALKQMLPPFRMGLGGPMGSGKQWFPWIHLEDIVGLYLWLLDNDVSGPVNGTAPEVARQGDFATALGNALHRPAKLPTPRLALRLMYGEFADTLFHSQKVFPEAAIRGGYAFRYPRLEDALAQSLRPVSETSS